MPLPRVIYKSRQLWALSESLTSEWGGSKANDFPQKSPSLVKKWKSLLCRDSRGCGIALGVRPQNSVSQLISRNESRPSQPDRPSQSCDGSRHSQELWQIRKWSLMLRLLHGLLPMYDPLLNQAPAFFLNPRIFLLWSAKSPRHRKRWGKWSTG